MFYNNAKKNAIKNLKKVQQEYKDIATQSNDTALALYRSRKAASKAIERIEMYINMLANSPKNFQKEIGDITLSISEFKKAVAIEEENRADNIKGASAAASGVIGGGAIAALGPTAAMAIATTFGTASTGTAIATLSGAAAESAALAWLGGGAVVAGGGGMAAGNAFLALAGPVGWGVAGVLVVGGGFFAAYKNKQAAEEAHKIAQEMLSKISMLRPKYHKLKNLLKRTDELRHTLDISLIVNTYPSDYAQFSVEQKEVLASLINNAKAMGELINERVY